jgi:hypothetical protein
MGGKEDLLVAIMRSAIEPLLEAATELRAGAPRPEEALVALVERQVRLHGTRPEAALVTDTEVRALRGGARSEVLALRDRYEAIWHAVVVDGARDGVFEVADASLTTKALLGLSGQVSHWYRSPGRLTLDEVCALQADLALGLVRARRDGRPLRRADLSA